MSTNGNKEEESRVPRWNDIDLSEGFKGNLEQFICFSSSLNYFIISYIRNLYICVVYNWAGVLRRPIESVMSIAMWAVSWILLLAMGIGLKIMDMAGMSNLFDYISKTYYKGNSMCNWGSPNLLEGKEKEVLKGIKTIHGDSPFAQFSMHTARASLILAASAYETVDAWKEFILRINGQNDDIYVSQVQKIVIPKTEHWIRILFFRNASKQDQVIICVLFRGTSPFSLTEWLTDLSLSKIDSSEYLWGATHEGFYTKMFQPMSGKNTAYDLIINALRDMIQTEGVDLDYSVFSTGHSLGAGLATVFYTRMLKTPHDLAITGAAKIKYVGGYTYGGPRVGNLDFAKHFLSATRAPKNRFVNLWRVADANDFAIGVPFGIDDMQTACLTCSPNGQDFLDYCHIGELVYLHRYKSYPFMEPPSQISTYKGLYQWMWEKTLIKWTLIYILDFFLSWKYLFEVPDFMNVVAGILPMIGDHLPVRYWGNLNNCDLHSPIDDQEEKDGADMPSYYKN